MRCQFQFIQENFQLLNGKLCHFRNVFPTDGNCQSFFFQTLAAAGLTGRDPHKLLIFLLHGLGSRLPVAFLHAPDQPLESHIVDAHTPLAFVVNLHHAAVGAMDQHMADFRRKILIGRFQIKAVFFGQGVQNCTGKAVLVRAGLPAHGRDGSFYDTQAFIRDHQILVKLHLVTQSIAVRAGAERVIEGKAPRLDLIDADAAVRAGKALAELQHFSVLHVNHGQAVSQPQNIFQGIGQSFFDARLHDKAVH